MNPENAEPVRRRPWAWIVVGLLMLGSMYQAIVDMREKDEQSAREAERRQFIVSSSQKAATLRRAFEQDKMAVLTSLEQKIASGNLHQALFDSYFAESKDPDLQNVLRTITNTLRPGQDLEPLNLAAEYACVATIAAVMKRDPRTIELDRIENAIAFLSYVRESDGKRWRQKCRLNGTTTQWGDADGRWQDTPADGLTSVDWSAEELLITEHHSDGSSSPSKWVWAKVR